ncbi:MAG: pseudouridine synthase [Phycisphaerales bacterium]
MSKGRGQNGRGSDLKDASRGERLQRVLADAGVASRRDCEELIRAGAVEVNGELVTELPAWVDPTTDRILVDGRPLPKPERHVYVMLNKPARVLSTAEDEPGADRKTVLDLVDHPERARLFPVGRLDYDSLGLVLLTNDGELANRITHPRFGVPKTYKVVVKGVLDEEAARELERGIYLAQRKAGRTEGAARTANVELAVLHQDRERTTLEITLREGRNRQVRRMLAAVGFPVKSLERVAVGPVRLRGVARGAWRELTSSEVQALRRAAAAPGKGGSGGTRSAKAGKGPKPKAGGKTRPAKADEGGDAPTLSRRAVKNAAHGSGRGSDRGAGGRGGKGGRNGRARG